jgi:hypothetical protein
MNPREFTAERIGEMVAGVSEYMRQERDMYVRHSEPLTIHLKKAIQGFFPQELLGCLKTITLKDGARIPPPPFYAEAKELSAGRFPDFVHMKCITYIDVIVFHDEIDVRGLFHGVVHATQTAVFGIRQVYGALRSGLCEESFVAADSTGGSGVQTGRAVCGESHRNIFCGRGNQSLG